MPNISFYFYFIYSYIRPFYLLIIEISNICNSDCQCKCNCSCTPKCKGQFICLCLCNCTKSSPSGFCICFCKKEDGKNNCECICICICKNEGKCCCENTQKHDCGKPLAKINLSLLYWEVSEIIDKLHSIESFTSKSHKHDSCESYCCCNNGKNNCLSVMARVNSIEVLFKKISENFGDLVKLKNTLSLLCLIDTKSPKSDTCKCKEKIKNLIGYIESAFKYYSLFESRINELGTFVQYKFNYKKIQHLLCSLKPTVGPLAKQLTQINDYIVNTSRTSNTTERFQTVTFSDIRRITNMSFWVMCSVINIMNYKSAIDRLFDNYKKVDRIFKLVLWTYGCKCIKGLEATTNNIIILKDLYLHYILDNLSSESRDKLREFFKLDLIRDMNKMGIDGNQNHLCLCMVNKYILYPAIMMVTYLLIMDLEMLSSASRRFQKYPNSKSSNLDITNFLNVCANFLYKAAVYILLKYKYNLKVTDGVQKICFCTYSNDPYYPYLVSIILYLSSLIENIWATDSNSIVTAIESLSSLYSELNSYDFTTKDIRQVSCSKICGLLVDKKCPGKKTSEKCCCLCVACYNLVLGCVYLCVQFKIYKAITKKDDNKLCTQIKDFCQIKECTGKQDAECCLLKLDLSSQLCNSSKEELEKLLNGCTQQTGKQEGESCKTIIDKVKAGGDLLVIGCKCETEGEQVKVQCVLFNNPWGGRNAAVVIACKCKDQSKCCCLTKLIEKLKGNGEALKKLCEKCQCDELKKQLQQLCTDSSCCGAGCPCKTLQPLLPKICGNGSDCLCKKIEKLKDLCTGNTCLCKKEGCCRCVCCKVLKGAVRVLTRACRQNFLEPYKRITIELLSGSKDNHVKRMIVNSINNSRQKQTFLVKNNYSTYFKTYTDHKNIANSFPGPTMGYGYDVVYEHQDASNSDYRGIDGIREGYLNIGCGRIIKRNKL